MSDLVTALVALLAVVVAVLGYGARQRVKGRRDAEATALRESAKRQERGRDAVGEIRGADRDELIDRLRRNDGRWD